MLHEEESNVKLLESISQITSQSVNQSVSQSLRS